MQQASVTVSVEAALPRDEYIKQLSAAFIKLLESARDNNVLIGVNLMHLSVQDMNDE